MKKKKKQVLFVEPLLAFLSTLYSTTSTLQTKEFE